MKALASSSLLVLVGWAWCGHLQATSISPGNYWGIGRYAMKPGVEHLSGSRLVPGSSNKRIEFQIVRVDPSLAQIGVFPFHKKAHTTRTWAQKHKLLMATNLGMFQADKRSHVGYLKRAGKVLQRRWKTGYLSAFVMGPTRRGKAYPKATLLDLDRPKQRAKLKHYKTIVQNLRLIKEVKKKGKGVWKKQAKKWSGTALALDGKGRLLFIYCNTPFSMWRWIREVQGFRLDLRKAMHLEGGPQASLSIWHKKRSKDWQGRFPSHRASRLLAVPNVFGVPR